MLTRLLALFLLLASPVVAKVHYVNQGVKYHIGDDRANRSVDSEFLDAYPVVGQEWIQAFTVSSEDSVKVRIEHVWGVDDCPYCKVIVGIGDHDMGRLTQDNNHEPFTTLQPLAMKVVPGRTYYLKIASYGTTQVDDFAIEGVSVETDHADVTFLQPGPILKMPGDPMPHVAVPVAPRGPCEGVNEVKGWLPGESISKGILEMAGAAEKNLAISLDAGSFVQVYVKESGSQNGDRVSQYIEVLLGEPASGWVFSFPPSADSAAHGNLKAKGRYLSDRFPVSAWRQGAWNELRLARCPDGMARLWLNGADSGRTIGNLPQGPLSIHFKTLGLSAQFAARPF